MSRASSIRVIHARQTWENMGRILGRELSGHAKSMLYDTRSEVARRGIPWELASARALHYLPYAEEYDPVYVDFVRAYAKGSGIAFEDLFSMICVGEKNLCTDIMVNSDVTSDGSVMSAHTEDWTPASQRHVVLISGEPKGCPSFLAVSLAGFELISGLN